MPQSWWVVVTAVAAVFGVSAIGVLIRRLGWLTEEADQSLLKIIIRVLFPCLIFGVISDNPALQRPDELFWPPLFGFASVALGCALAWGIAYWRADAMRLSGPAAAGTFALCIGLHNYGFIPLPLVQLLFDDTTVGVLFLHNVGVEVAIWTFGIMLLTGAVGRHWWRNVINAPFIAIVVAMACNLLGLAPLVPSLLNQIIDWLGQAAIPMSLLLAGATIADQLSAPDRPPRGPTARIVFWACVLRLGVLPALFLLGVWLLPATVDLQRVVIIEAAMPSAVIPIVLARHYGGQPAVATQIVLATSVVSLITVPLWIAAGFWWLGLSPEL